MKEEYMPIGVIVKGDDPIASLKRVKSLGIPTCQMFVPPEEWQAQSRVNMIKNAALETEVKITAFFCHFKGESYADLPTTKRTVGLINPDTRQERIRKIFIYSNFARKLNIPVLAAHIGFIPEDRSSLDYKKIVRALRKITDYCQTNNQFFALETGQERARALAQFIEEIDRKNLRINFDPANMLLYNREEPIQALDVLGKYVIGVHCKDGKRPQREGESGKEYPLGEGDVNIKKFIGKLKEIGYTGSLTIEREISGEEQTRDILKAKKLLEKLR